jgi:hypothetical protein
MLCETPEVTYIDVVFVYVVVLAACGRQTGFSLTRLAYTNFSCAKRLRAWRHAIVVAKIVTSVPRFRSPIQSSTSAVGTSMGVYPHQKAPFSTRALSCASRAPVSQLVECDLRRGKIRIPKAQVHHVPSCLASCSLETVDHCEDMRGQTI